MQVEQLVEARQTLLIAVDSMPCKEGMNDPLTRQNSEIPDTGRRNHFARMHLQMQMGCHTPNANAVTRSPYGSRYSKLWKSKRFNEMCVLGGGEISGNFWKSVRCCVQLVFIMFVFFPFDGLSWVFYGYHADGCSYSLVFWEFCTSLVARSVVQDSYKHRRILCRCYNKCLWGKARMGTAYPFNLLMYFLALRIGTRRLPVISFWVYPLYSQRWKSWQLYTCLPSLRPFVSPLSPLLALCLLFSLLALACSCCLAWFPLLLHRWKLLNLIVLKRMWKRVATKEFGQET